jgi:hypothetical protein
MATSTTHTDLRSLDPEELEELLKQAETLTIENAQTGQSSSQAAAQDTAQPNPDNPPIPDSSMPHQQ